jgi:hypothetical protein
MGVMVRDEPTAFMTLTLGILLVSLLFIALRDLGWPSQSQILDHNERPFNRPVSTQWTAGFISVTILSLCFVVYGSSAYYRRSHTGSTPAAPVGLSAYSQAVVHFQGELVTLRQRRDHIGPCETKGHRIYSSIEALPGAPDYNRPYLVIEPKALVLRLLGGDAAKVFVDTTVVNREEATVAIDWRLCMASEGKAYWYTASDITDDLTSLNERKSLPEFSSQTIEHGDVRRGWLVFEVPFGLVSNWKYEGGIKCRDYLEHESETSFSPN